MELNQLEAMEILSEELILLQTETYDSLMGRMKHPIVYQRIGKSGVEYQLEIEVFWDDKIHGDLRVIGSIDDGKIAALFPLTLDFIKKVSQGGNP